jgi:predicted acetyltransferase
MAPSPNDLDIRLTEPHEYRIACDTMRAALLSGPTSDEEWPKFLDSWETQISMTAWDGDACAGHAGAFRLHTVVPGGAWLPTAAVTRVGVLPTYTRRGALTRMMHRLLLESRAEGHSLASLRASEAVIYRRFGFAVAGDAASIRVNTTRVRPIANTAAGSFRLLKPAEVLDLLPVMYERIPHRPGAISRLPHMWRRYYSDVLEAKDAHFVVVHTSPDGIDDGFAHYSLSWCDPPYEPGPGKGEVFDLFGASPQVELALWDYVTGIDLVHYVKAGCRPMDDLLHTAAHDSRSYFTVERYDEQWIRLLDVEAALTARSYGTGGPVEIAVTDPLFPDNTGTFRVAPAGAERVPGSGELEVDIATLSAAYMGNVSWAHLAAVGRVNGPPDAVARADALFALQPASWCGTFF